MTVCKNCKGVGYIIVDDRYSSYHTECWECDGKGVVEPMTNEEWLHTLTTEQLADFLFKMADMCSYCGDEAHRDEEKIQKCYFGKIGCQREDWVEWLKEKHDESV